MDRGKEETSSTLNVKAEEGPMANNDDYKYILIVHCRKVVKAKIVAIVLQFETFGSVLYEQQNALMIASMDYDGTDEHANHLALSKNILQLKGITNE